MAVCSDVAREKFLLRRVVHVDVVFVGKHELHGAQRVGRTGRLAHPEREVARVVGVEVDLRAVHGACFRVEYLKRGLRVRILLQLRQNLAHRDRPRYMPNRIDCHVSHDV